MSDGIETIRNAEVDDVAVRKTIETGDDDTATVTLKVTADREEPLTVRVAEPALADVPTDDVDIHGDHGAERWRLDEGAVFERGFDGGGSCTVVYRVRDVDEERFRDIDADPELEIDAGAPGGLDDVVDREGSEAVRRLIEGRADSLSVTDIVDDEAGADADDRSTGAGARRPPDGPPTADSGSDGAVAGAGHPGTTAAAPDGVAETVDGIEETSGDAEASDGLAAVLLAELRAGEVDDEVARELREELRVGKSQDVRISHLQRQVADLAAYADALETFIDEHGPFDEAFGDLLADVEGVDRDVAAIRDDLEALSKRVTDEVDDLDRDVAALEDGQDAVRDRVGTVEGEREALGARLDDLESFADRLSGAFQHVDEDGDH